MGTISKPPSKRGTVRSKPKGDVEKTASYWDSVGCRATPLWLRIRQTSDRLMKDERSFVRAYWDLGEELESLKEEIKDYNKTRKGDEPRRSFDAEATFALGSKARVYRVQNIYAFFGEGQKQCGAKASKWPFTLSDLLGVIQEMGPPQANQKRFVMERIEKGSDYDALIDSISTWLEDRKAAKAKERERAKAATQANSLANAVAAQRKGQEAAKNNGHGRGLGKPQASDSQDVGYDHQQWEEGDGGSEKQADDETNAICHDLIGRFKNVAEAIAYLIENFWGWDDARDFIADEWERRSPLPNCVEAVDG